MPSAFQVSIICKSFVMGAGAPATATRNDEKLLYKQLAALMDREQQLREAREEQAREEEEAKTVTPPHRHLTRTCLP
jgi:hypothetical protein